MRDSWTRTTLGEIIEHVRRPVVVEAEETYREFGTRMHYRGLFPKEPVSGEQLGSKRVFRLVPGDLVINIVFAWNGGVAVAGPEVAGAIASHRFPTYRARGEACDVRYMKLFFESQEGRRLLIVNSPGSAGSNKTLNQSRLLGEKIRLPGLVQQRRIVDLIEAVDAYIAASHRYAASLEGSIRVLRDALLTDHPRRELGDHLESVDGGTSLACPDDPPEPDEPRILKLSAVRPGGFVGAEAKRLPADHGLPPRAKVEVGDVLMTRSNTPERVGYACLVTELTAPTYMPDLMFRLVPTRDGIVPAYLAEVLNCTEVRTAVTASASGTSASMRKINKAKVRAYSVPVAPRDEQERIAAFLGDARAVARAAADVRKRTESVRSALLADLLSGEHEIPASYDRLLESVG